ncbi:hypothetical protein Patl1_37669 [Pistacia atlantica]|nr:hypothetical protein Patl1_37669 [Pistacia atlantica]
MIPGSKGFFVNAYANNICSMSLDEGDNSMKITEDGEGRPSLNVLFAEAIKGPLLSSRPSPIQHIRFDLPFLSSKGARASRSKFWWKKILQTMFLKYYDCRNFLKGQII